MPHPTVSAIIPCYNHGKYLDDAVRSIQSQTYEVSEIIIVNDGSDENETNTKLKEYSRSDVIVHNIANGGPSRARNYGINRALGEFILLMDADDYCEDIFVDRAVQKLLGNRSIGGVSSGVKLVGDVNRKYIPPGGGIKEFLLHPGALNFGLIRRKCWEESGGYDENMRKIGYEDWDFWINITKLGYEIYVIPEYLFYYRWHDQENSRRAKSHENRVLLIEQLVKKHRAVYAENVVSVIVGKEKKILEVKRERDSFKSSLEYRLGKKVLSPLRWVQKLVRSTRDMNQ